jgi:hypothetical protein
MNRNLLQTVGLWGLLASLVLCQGCFLLKGDRRYYSRTQAKDHFYKHQAEFSQLASAWVNTHRQDDLMFRPWHKDEVRWNGTNIVQAGGKYEVQRGNTPVQIAQDFGAAATLAGANPSDLSMWVGTFRRLDVSFIYVVGTKLPITEQYVEIGLQESGAPYGYLYVPAGNKQAEAMLDSACAKGSDLVDMRQVVKLAPQWFYFEGK